MDKASVELPCCASIGHFRLKLPSWIDLPALSPAFTANVTRVITAAGASPQRRKPPSERIKPGIFCSRHTAVARPSVIHGGVAHDKVSTLWAPTPLPTLSSCVQCCGLSDIRRQTLRDHDGPTSRTQNSLRVKSYRDVARRTCYPFRESKSADEDGLPCSACDSWHSRTARNATCSITFGTVQAREYKPAPKEVETGLVSRLG